MQIIKGHRGRVHGLEFSPDGTKLASIGGRGASISLWNLGAKPRREYLSGHYWPVKELEFSPDGQMLVSVDVGYHVSFWDVAEAWRIPVEIRKEHDTGLYYGWGSFHFVSRRELLSLGRASGEYALGSWRLEQTGKDSWIARVRRERSQLQRGWCVALAITPGGQLAAVGIRATAPTRNLVDLWRRGETSMLGSFHSRDSIHDLAFTPDGKTLAIASGKRVILCNVPAGPQIESLESRAVLRGHQRMITAVRPTADGRHLFTGSTDGQVKVWDVNPGKEVQALDWQIGAIHSLALTADGMRAAAGGAKGEIIIWDVDL